MTEPLTQQQSRDEQRKAASVGVHLLCVPMFIAMALGYCLLGTSIATSHHLVKQKRPMFTHSGNSVSVVGHEIGKTFDVPECPIDNAGTPERQYAYALPVSCFKHLDRRDAGKPLTGAQLVWLEQMDRSTHYAAFGLADAVCAGVVDGKLEAIDMQLHRDDDVESDARSAFGSPESEVVIQPETDAYRYYFSMHQWVADDVTVQFTSKYSSPKAGGHSSPFYYSVMVFSAAGKALIGDEWKTMGSQCYLQ